LAASLHHANEALGKGAYAEAAAGFAAIVAADPFNHPAFQGLAIAYLCLNEGEKSLDAIARALILDPGCIEYLIVQAEAHRLLKDLPRARDSLERAIEIEPAHYALYNNLGVVEKVARNYAQAAALFQKAIALKPDYVDAIYNHARLSAQTGDFSESQRYLTQARQMQPADPRFQVAPAQLVEAPTPTAAVAAVPVSDSMRAHNADTQHLKSLRAALDSGKIALHLDVKKLALPSSPIYRASDSNQAFAVAFALIALLAWQAPLLVSVPAALFILIAYQMLLPHFLKRRFAARIRSEAATDLDAWTKLWKFGGLTLADSANPGVPMSDWRDLPMSESP